MMHAHDGLWRSLDESDPCRVDHGHAAVATLSRREFLKFAAAAAAVSGAGCRAPVEEIVPAVHPDRALPGVPMVFATAMALGGSATGLLVESNAGRPTKIEGNPGHPSSLGATDGFAQAAILDLWNPERSKVVRRRGRIEARSALETGLRDALAKLGEGGEGLRILSGYTSSPTLVGQMRSLASRYPGMRWHFWEALHRDQSLEGARLAFGRAVEPVYKPENADVVLALDAQLRAPGHTVAYIEPVTGDVRCGDSLRELVEDLRGGRVRMLCILGGNPAYDAPVDFELGDLVRRVPFSLHLALEEDETSQA